MSSLVCVPLDRKQTRKISSLHSITSLAKFDLKTFKINNVTGESHIQVKYPETKLYRLSVAPDQKCQILPSGGVAFNRKILDTGFEGQQAYNILGYLKSAFKQKQSISGNIVCSWSHQFLTYGDFVLQLLPELCLIKSQVSAIEWQKITFVFDNTPKFLVEYLKLLGCEESQIIDSHDRCFEVLPESQIYFREKDPMWFLCAPQELICQTREYLLKDSFDYTRAKKIVYVERIDGYRQAIGLDETVRKKLVALGVYFFNPSAVSIAEQIATFRNADLVIGVHGAGLANLMWCRQKTTVIEIFHPNYAPWCYLILANQLNLNYYCLGRHPGSMDVNYRESDVEIDWDNLIEMLEYLSRENSICI